MPLRSATLVTLLAWQLLCLSFCYLYIGIGLGDFLTSGFVLIFGEVQENYSAYTRAISIAGLLVITLPATCASLWLYDKLASSESGLTRCRHCGSVLEGLERPVCPACGTKI